MSLSKKVILVALLGSSFLMSKSVDKNITKEPSTVEKKVTKSSSSSAVWVKNGSLTPLAQELIEQMKKDKTISYDLPFYKSYKRALKHIKQKKVTNKELNKLYYSYMNYLIKGGINWSAFRRDIERLKKKYDYAVGWEVTPPPYSAKKILKNATLNGSFNNIFKKVEPRRFKYPQMKKYLVKYIDIRNKGGLPKPGKIPTLKPGTSHPAIKKIKKQLKLLGDLSSSCPINTTYDKCMVSAVKRFKIRHGLQGTSVINRATRNELNTPIGTQIRKIRLNMDRIKWIRRKEPRVRIEVNIPEFRLYIYDGKELVTTMRVVTGKPDHPTPVFSDTLTTVVVNPYWKIPESIVKKEMLKKLIKNPHYYEKQGKYLYKTWNPKSPKINPAKVNWKQYLDSKKTIPYHFMQEPGHKNALGRIKFLFPNKYSVYIHDTPSKKLFFRNTRAFSHGCMRIQKPKELLKALALYNDNINVDKVMRKLGTTDNTSIGLKRRIPIDIVYLTSFVDNYGNLHFRKDIYGYDKLQLKHYYKAAGAIKKRTSHKKKKKVKKEKAKPKAKKDPNIIEIGY